MSGRDHVSAGLQRIVKMTGDPSATVDLSELKEGDTVWVKTDDIPKNNLDLTIIRPAKKGANAAEDSATAWLPGWKWDKNCQEEKVKVLIGGSCNYRPGSTYGVTMLSIGKLTVGRNFILWLDGTDNALIFSKPILKLSIVKK